MKQLKPWRGRRFAYRPHDNIRARLRRVKQIVFDQLPSDYETRLEAQDCLLDLAQKDQGQKDRRRINDQMLTKQFDRSVEEVIQSRWSAADKDGRRFWLAVCEQTVWVARRLWLRIHLTRKQEQRMRGWSRTGTERS